MSKKLAIIGAGSMGLAAAFYAIKKGYKVTIFETDKIPGGMAAHFDLDGLSIERFYHFICKTDNHTFQLLSELGIKDSLRWRETKMGYYINGNIYPWGNPLSLLKFPLMNIFEKIRYGFFIFLLTKKKNFSSIEDKTMKVWLQNAVGKRIYELMWERVIKLKFYEYTDSISASWIATRIKRLGKSRKSIFAEELGYIEGGSEHLIKELVSFIERNNGKLYLSTPVTEIISEKGKVTGIKTKDNIYEFDDVICTIPTPNISQMIPTLSKEEKDKFDSIKNIGVVCVVHKLSKQVTENFWLNIVDKDIDIPGIIEFSNLRKTNTNVVYIPYYMPITNPKFDQLNESFIEESKQYILKINPQLNTSDFLASSVGRLRHSQPICTPNFKDKLPSIQTSIQGLQVADTSYYYPEDRGISESIGLAKEMVNNLKI